MRKGGMRECCESGVRKRGERGERGGVRKRGVRGILERE